MAPRNPPRPFTQLVRFALDDGTPSPVANDGRPIFIGSTAKRTTNFRLRAICFYTGRLQAGGGLHNVNPVTDTDYGDAMLTVFDADKQPITDPANLGNAVRSVVDWSPHYDYEIIGGSVDAPQDLIGGTTDQWYISCVGVPDLPPEMYGSVPFINDVNIEAITSSKISADGRAVSFMPYEVPGLPLPPGVTNKLRFTVKYPPGAQVRFQILIEHFV